MKILLVDNNDSFTYNLVDLLKCHTSAEVFVIPSKQVNPSEVSQFDKIIFSPGPGLPQENPAMYHILKQYGGKKNILGICLGMQAICHFYGNNLYNMPQVVHGQQHDVVINNHNNIFVGLPATIKVGLYHSWAVQVDTLSTELETLAFSEEGVLMAVKHKKQNIFGLQFHPESHLTPQGIQIIKNFYDN